MLKPIFQDFNDVLEMYEHMLMNNFLHEICKSLHKEWFQKPSLYGHVTCKGIFIFMLFNLV